MNNRKKLKSISLFLVLCCLSLALGVTIVAHAEGGIATVAFKHFGDGTMIDGGELILTAPETIGAEHNFLHWMVDGQQVDGRTITVDMSSASNIEAIYNPLNTPVTIELRDGNGDLITTGGSLRYHDGSWHDLGTGNNDGTWTLSDTDATQVTYEMTFNNGRQTFSNIPTSQTTVTFDTVSTNVALEDSSFSPLNDGGTVRFHQIGWQNWGSANTVLELLPGNYTFEMTYNNGRQTYSSYAVADEGGGADTVLFQTVTVTPALQDSDTNSLGEGVVRYHQIGWENWDDAANTSMELLPGNYTFEMTYNNGKQTFSSHPVPAGDTHVVLFTTVTVTPALKKSDNAVLSGGTVRYHQIGWQDWIDANTEKELLPGNYTFEMTFNNGRQTFSTHEVPAGAAHEVLFTTVSTTVSLKDNSGMELGSGTVRYHQIGWQNFGAGNDTLELLPGNYTFEMTYNNGKQTFSTHEVPAGAAHTVPFVTTTNIVRLADCGDNGHDGGTVRYHQIGWQNYGTTASGNVTQELLPGNYTFEMTFNNGRQTFSNHTVPDATSEDPHTVMFTTSAVTFGYPGTVRYHQLGWQDFIQPTMNLLPGNYTFNFVDDNITLSNEPVSGCNFDGDLTVEFPGISSVHTYVRQSDNVEGTATGSAVASRTHKTDQAVFDDLPMGIYDILVVKGGMNKVIDDVVVVGPTTVDNIVATLNIEFPGISSVHSYVKVDDGLEDSATGSDVDSRTHKSDGTSLAVLKGVYDVVIKKGALTYYADGVDCNAETCTVSGIVKTLAVNFPGISSVHTYVKVDDGIPDSATGGDVDSRTHKTDGTSLAVLNGVYDVRIVKGAMIYYADAVDCTPSGDCLVDGIVATLTIEFPGISSVHSYIKVDDGNTGTANGGDVDSQTHKTDGTSLAVLNGVYDVRIVKGAMVYYADAVDCTGSSCTVDNIVKTMTVSFPGISSVHTYVKVDDNNPNTVTGGDVDSRTHKTDGTSLAVLKGYYDVLVKKGAQTNSYHSVDCTDSGTCLIDDIVAQLTVEFPGYSGVHTYVKVDDEILNSATGGDVDSRTHKSNEVTIPVLKAFYDVVINIGGNTGIADAVDCTGNICVLDGGDLTIYAPNGTGVEIRTSDGSTVVASVSNVGSDKQHVFADLTIGIYDVYLTQGGATTIIDDIFFISDQILDQLEQWTVIAPNGTRVEVRVPDTSSLVTGVSNVGSDKEHVFDVVPNTYDLYLEQGAGEKTVEDIAVTPSLTTDELCQLTVYAPNGTRVEVRTTGGDDSDVVTSVTNVGSDKEHVFDVVKGTYDVFLKQGVGEKTVANVGCNDEVGSVDQLVQWTVFAPNGTSVEVLTAGDGIVTSVSNVGSDKKHVFDVVPNTYNLFLSQGAGTKTVLSTDVSTGASTDELCALTVIAPNGTAVEVRNPVGSGVVTSVSNVGSDKEEVFDVLKLTYDLNLTQGASSKTVSDIDCTGETGSEVQLVQWTVQAPNGTAVEVRTPDGDATDVVTSVSNVGSDKEVVFDVVPNTYDLYLEQGAAQKTVSGVSVLADLTTEEICELTVFAPNGTAVEVRVHGSAAVVTSVSNVGSDNQHVFDVVKGTYDVFDGSTTLDGVDCNGSTASATFL